MGTEFNDKLFSNIIRLTGSRKSGLNACVIVIARRYNIR